MATCIRCKKVLDDGDATCDFCGISQRGSAPATAAAPHGRQREFPATPPPQQQQRPQAQRRPQPQRPNQPRPTSTRPASGGGGGGKVMLVLLILAGVMIVTKLPEITAWWKVKQWNGRRTLYCSGNDKMTVKHRTVIMSDDVAIHASGKCRLTLTNVTIENARSTIMASGQARVTLIDSTLLASSTAITVMDSARVSVIRGRVEAPNVATANGTNGVIELGVGTVTAGEIVTNNGGRVLDQR